MELPPPPAGGCADGGCAPITRPCTRRRRTLVPAAACCACASQYTPTRICPSCIRTLSRCVALRPSPAHGWLPSARSATPAAMAGCAAATNTKGPPPADVQNVCCVVQQRLPTSEPLSLTRVSLERSSLSRASSTAPTGPNQNLSRNTMSSRNSPIMMGRVKLKSAGAEKMVRRCQHPASRPTAAPPCSRPPSSPPIANVLATCRGVTC